MRHVIPLQAVTGSEDAKQRGTQPARTPVEIQR